MDEEQVRKNLAALWKKYLPEMDGRVSVLERACESLTAGELPDEERRSALAAAHKLAGALGTFGRGHGTELAREIESMLQSSHVTRGQIAEMKSKLMELRSMLGQV